MKSLGKKSDGLRLERMRSSSLWTGEGFRNIHPVLPGLRDASARAPSLSEFLCGGERRVPSRELPSIDPHDVWSRAPSAGLRATWLGHSTVKITSPGGTVLLIDPWVMNNPKTPDDQKTIDHLDLMVITHGHYDHIGDAVQIDHYDHLDLPTVRELAKFDVPFVTCLGVGAHLEAWGVRAERIVELDWWESYRLPNAELSVTAGPSQHFSGRGLHDRNATLWSSMIIRSARHAVFFSGDTGLTTQYAEIRERFGPFDLVMLEVGGFHPSWGHIHLGPENALEALALLGGGAFLPVHWGTFALALHDWDQPAEALLALGPKQGAQLLMPRLGEPVEPAQAQEVTLGRQVRRVQLPPQALPEVEDLLRSLQARGQQGGGGRGTAPAIPLLQTLRGHDEWRIRDAAGKALKNLEGQ